VAALFRGLAPALRKEEVGQEVGRVVIWRQHYFSAWALSLPQRIFGHVSFSSEQYFIGNGSNTGNSDEITTVKTRIDI
jgi:hypothetical protein